MPQFPGLFKALSAGLLLLALLAAAAAAQPAPDSGRAADTTGILPLLAELDPVDTVPVPPAPFSKWIVPEVEILLSNGLIASYNIFIAQHDWARISGSSVRRNLISSWIWDYDQFYINQFLHPYQGGLYYSAARSYGHGYYMSTAFTAMGSLQWEYLMETEAPSYNDFITTTLGGAMVGEISYRLANSVLDNNASGLERFSRELLASAINPVLGFNRVLNGNAWSGPRRLRSPKPEKESIVRLSTGTTLAYGSDAETEDHNPLRVPKANTEMLVIYGDPYAATKPFDYFLLNMGLNVIRDPVATFSARAQLYKWNLFRSGRGRGLLMVGQNFDYLNNGVYKLGTSSIGVGYSHRFEGASGYYHTFHAQAAGIAVGGVSTEFFREHSRDYNLGPGLFGTTRITVGKGFSWRAALVSDRYWLRTRSGAKGDEIIGVTMLEAYKHVHKGFGVLVSHSNYDRSARYRDYGTKQELSQETKALVTLTLR
ncbi:MAG: hypothetical protein K0Q91_1544 [Fibrobacteria bacterium]|nr:hypothetical protein [Fibrobacteria bacterium]